MNKGTLSKINKALDSDFRLDHKFEGGNANTNYLITNSSGEKLVARVLKNQKPEYISAEYTVQKYLTRRGVPTSVIRPLPNGDLIFKTRNISVTFTKFIDSNKSKPDPVSVGEILALYQKALKDFDRNILRPNWLSKDYHLNLRFKRRDKEITKTILNKLDTLYTEMSSIKPKKAIIHGDLNIGNMLRKEHKIVAVIDLESTEYNFRILDIGMSIFQISPHYSFEYNRLKDEILEGYTKITKLSKAEVDQIKNATLYSAACSSLWNLSFEGGSKDFLKKFLDLQKKISRNFK